MRLRDPIQPARAAALALALAAGTLLPGCDSTSGGSSIPANNDGFPERDATDSSFNDSGAGGGNNDGGLDGNQLRVSVQVPAELAEGEPGRRNLLTTTDASLRVTRVDANLREQATLDPDIDTVNDDFILTFDDRSSAPSDVDLIVSATVNGQTFSAPLAAGSKHIQLNPFTDFLVSRVIGDRLEAGDINDIKSCEATLCPEGLIWSPLVDQVQNFEIDIPADRTSPRQAREFLDSRADFAGFVEQATSALILGQERISSFEGETETATTFFNTVYFGASLNRDRPGSTPFWASRTITRGESTNSAGTGFAFPNLTLTSFAIDLLDISVTSLALDVPYIRDSAGRSQLDGSTNTHSTSPGSAFIRDGKTLIASRPLFQSITNRNDTTIGWAPDPHFLAGYLPGDPDAPEAFPGAVLASYFQAGKTLELSRRGNDGFDRETTLEDQATANLELSFPEWEENDGSEFNPPNDGSYNMVGFELIPAFDGSGPSVRATFGRWDVSARTPARSVEDTTGADSIVWELGSSGVNDGSGNNNPYEGGADLELLPVRNSTQDSPGFRGHLLYNHDSVGIRDTNVPDEQGGPIPNAALTPDSRWIALSAATTGNTNGTGDLVRIAHAPSVDDRVEAGDEYRIVGFEVTVNGDEERLRQLNGSCLQAGGDSAGTQLFERGIEVAHNRGIMNSYQPARRFDKEPVTLGAIPESGNRFAIVEANASGDPTELRGYVADNGDTLVMVKKTGPSLGILLGFREDEPEGCPAS